MSRKRQPVFLHKSVLGIFYVALITIFLSVILCFVLSKTPIKTLQAFFFGPFKNVYYFGNMINSAVPLIFGGLAISIAMSAGNFNLGGEGQIYVGAFTTTIIAIALENFGIFGGIVALIGGCLVSGFVAGISGVLKAKWDTNELITTFLLSNSLVLIVNYFITGPFLDAKANLQSTKEIPSSMQLNRILPPSQLSNALFISIIVTIFIYFLLRKTRIGYEFKVCGTNSHFAIYGGINVERNIILSMVISGALYGLGGGLAIFGTYHSCIKEFHTGIGWNSIAVALIAGFHPIAVIPGALFFSWISSGARIAMQQSDVTLELAAIIQAIVFLLITCDIFFKNKKERKLL